MIWGIRDRNTFARLRREGVRSRHGAIALTYLPEDHGDPPRVAYVVSGKVGNAVVRNKVRRRVRSIVADLGRELYTDGRSASPSVLRSGAYLVRLDPTSTARTFGELVSDVERAVLSAHRRADDRFHTSVGS